MRIPARAQQLLAGGSRRQVDAHPRGMSAAAEQLDDVLQRAMLERWPARSEHTLDFGEQSGGVTINFQGQVPALLPGV